MSGDQGASDSPARIETLVDALVDGDRERATRLFGDHLEDSGSFLATIDELVRPAMAEIGVRWERGEVSVAEEHLATATMQTIVAQRLPDLSAEAGGEGSILLACVEENQHELGLRVLADAFELAGWETRFLGADVPTAALVSMVDRWRPDVVALSVSMDLHVPVAREVVGRVRELGEPQPTILLGGPLDREPENVLENVQADAWAGGVQRGVREAMA